MNYEEVIEKRVKSILFKIEDAEKNNYISIPEIKKIENVWCYESEKQKFIIPDNTYIMKQHDDWIFFEEPINFEKKYQKV